MRFLVIDDNDYMREAVPAIIAEHFPDAKIIVYEDLFIAKDCSVDVLVIDISSICPVIMAHAAYAPICRYLDDHPGTRVIINSAVGIECAKDVRDDILRMIPTAEVSLAGYPFHETIPIALKALV